MNCDRRGYLINEESFYFGKTKNVLEYDVDYKMEQTGFRKKRLHFKCTFLIRQERLKV